MAGTAPQMHGDSSSREYSLDQGFCYMTMVSDGDYRTFKRLSEMKTYGVNVTDIKEECVTMSPRAWGWPRKQATQTKKTGMTLGGPGHGKLKGTTVSLLTIYMRAICSYPDDLDGMENAVLASFCHISSTDANSQYNRWLNGKDSWCFLPVGTL